MNTIEMHLNETVYQLIKNGTKRIEIRLLDEKRKGVRLGDEIIFINRADDDDRVRAKVIGLLFYNNFAELVADYEIEILMDKSMTKEDLLKELNKFYSAEEQAELGVVGIRFELLDDDLLYSYRSEGTDYPKYRFCKVYKSGKVEFGDGWLIKDDEKTEDSIIIPAESISKIKKLISDNPEVFNLKDIEEVYVLDGTMETICFCNDGKKNTIHVNSLWSFIDSDTGTVRFPKHELLVKMYVEIKKILIESGISEEYL